MCTEQADTFIPDVSPLNPALFHHQMLWSVLLSTATGATALSNWRPIPREMHVTIANVDCTPILTMFLK